MQEYLFQQTMKEFFFLCFLLYCVGYRSDAQRTAVHQLYRQGKAHHFSACVYANYQ